MNLVTSPLSVFVSIPLSVSLALGSTLALAAPPAEPATGTTDTGVTAEEMSEAEALSERAIAEFSAENYAGAVELFEQAYAIDPQPNYLFNIGRVHEEAADLEKAVDHYARFVKQPGVDIKSRELALERLRVLRAILAETKEPTEEPSKDEPNSSGMTLEPPGQPVDTGHDRKRKIMRDTGFGLAAGGASVLIGAAVVGALARSDANKAFDRGEAESLEARQGFLDKSRTKAVTADVLYGVGGALLLTGVVLIAVGYSKPKTQRVAVTPNFGRQRLGAARSGWSSSLDLRVSF